MYNCIICRYHEIAIKGDNRIMFESKLMDNMRSHLLDIPGVSVERIRGRIFVRRHQGSASFNKEEIEKIETVLSKTFGLESFSPALECESKEEAIFNAVEMTAKSEFEKALEGKKAVTFRIRARRSDKSFPLRSKQIEIDSAGIIEKLFGREKIDVNLTDAEITVGIEVREKSSFVFYRSVGGPGGLPVGSNAPVLALLSGGIDSPVACRMAMKRGCQVHFLTFHSHPYTSMESVEKVKRISKVLNGLQPKGKLFICNLSPLQKMIRDICIPKYRTVLYRRMMMRIAEKVCKKQELFAIVTGESVGQVASQTVVNLATINSSTEMLVLRPLIGMDKVESIEAAQRLGTYQISIEPAPDSCTVFAPPAPAVRARLDQVEMEERRLGDWQSVLEDIFAGIETEEGL